MIEQLRAIGLSDLEARCYLALHEEPGISGYEVAKRVSVSRTNVYSALRVLGEKGICRTIESETVLYEPVPIDQVIALLRSDFERTTQRLLEELKAPPKRTASFGSWKGDKAVETTIRRLIANAERSILVDIWAEDLHWVETPLLEAESRGVAVVVVVIGEAHSPLKRVIAHQRLEEWGELGSRRFSLLCDHETALLGSFGQAVQLTALESDHPSVLELLHTAFFHDIVMERIEQDFSEELAGRYGRHYENIKREFGGVI